MEQNNSQQAVALRFQINEKKVNIDTSVFKKSDNERLEVKEAKSDSRRLNIAKRNEFIMAFLNAEVPNWNVKLIVK